MIRETNPPMVAAVGDVVSRETLKAGLKVDLRIVDNRSMRKDLSASTLPAKKTYTIKNPPGVITLEAQRTIRKAVGEAGSVIFVEGEEDLLVLPVILESPNGSMVLYGQPSEGLVAVTVTDEKKSEVAGIMDRMVQA
jgi:GTP-dependent dephospho-CoA kinase